jgi:hypothetical protein
MSVSQNDAVYPIDIDRQLTIAPIGLCSPPLKKTTIYEDVVTVDGQEMHRAGHPSHRTQECYLQFSSTRLLCKTNIIICCKR